MRLSTDHDADSIDEAEEVPGQCEIDDLSTTRDRESAVADDNPLGVPHHRNDPGEMGVQCSDLFFIGRFHRGPIVPFNGQTHEALSW